MAFSDAKSAGVQFIEIPQQWDEVETEPEKYNSPFLKMANVVYPRFNTSIVLSINPIDTSVLRIPTWLLGKRFDDETVISEFCQFVDFVFAGLPNATVIAVSIGNEVDQWLADDPEKWTQYVTFMTAVRDHIRLTRPNLPVGVKTTWSSTLSIYRREIQDINRNTDALMITYYPLNQDFTVRLPNVVPSDLEQVIRLADGKPVYLLETGYPSGSKNQSSEEKQAEFIDTVFSTWDQHADTIKLVNFVWLHDLSPMEVAAMTQYYSVKNPAFASFIGTLGLKTYDGKAKAAFSHVKERAAERGWK